MSTETLNIEIRYLTVHSWHGNEFKTLEIKSFHFILLNEMPSLQLFPLCSYSSVFKEDRNKDKSMFAKGCVLKNTYISFLSDRLLGECLAQNW